MDLPPTVLTGRSGSVEAAPLVVGRVFNAVDVGCGNPAASSTGIKCVDSDHKRTREGSHGVQVDRLPVAARVRVTELVRGGVAVSDVGALTVDVGLVGTVQVERVRVVAGNGDSSRASSVRDWARVRKLHQRDGVARPFNRNHTSDLCQTRRQSGWDGIAFVLTDVVAVSGGSETCSKAVFLEMPVSITL